MRWIGFGGRCARQNDPTRVDGGQEPILSTDKVFCSASGIGDPAAYLPSEDQITICDEHVETLRLDDEPDLVVIQVYITSARRAYEIADTYRRRGIRVVMGGLHVTSLPEEAAAHADTIFLGPGEEAFPRFLADLKHGSPATRYASKQRTLLGVPPIRRDLIKRGGYLVPNSIVVSRGCPHVCDFCYKVAFFRGGKHYYTQTVDDALAEIDRLPGGTSTSWTTTSWETRGLPETSSRG